ncbi:hypothetical protein BCR42DRAFT_411901 [Absidia repens]|uniref:Uncharacterized protein n=1 Tax=Absidia repens TaxID=90262 RepID=A0A1X2IME2_9FUNG|nr:hypothetical protein BCR42DRAFT_411901 [Absidia repens]
MFNAYNSPYQRNFGAFNPAMPPHHSPMGMSPYSSWHTPQPMSPYYPPASVMNHHNAFHGSPFDYQPDPYGGHPYPMPGQSMMDPYYGGMYKEPSMFDSCCPPRNPYDDHMLPPYPSQHPMQQSKPDHHHHRHNRQETSVNHQPQQQQPSQSQSRSQTQTQQNRSSSQSQSQSLTRQQRRY